MDVVDVLSITDQVLDVLIAAHDKGIVHRDLKPDNLFVTREGSVKVLDFGIARLREGSSGATHTGISMGTPSYMAQEQARALWNEVDARTDLWAVGATMFACLVGRVVHDGRTMNEMLLSAMTKTAPPIRSLVPTLSYPVAEAIDRALAFEREGRFANAAEMQSALRMAYEAMQSAPLSTAPRLVVPDIAMQRTVPSTDGVALPAPAASRPVEARTGEPVVAAGDSGVGVSAMGGRRTGVAVAAGFVAIAVVGAVWLATRGGSRPESGSSVSAAAVPSSSAAASATATASAAPSVGPSAAPTTVAAPAGAGADPVPPKTDKPDAKKKRGAGDPPPPKVDAPPVRAVEDLPPAPTRKAQGPMEQTL